MRKIFYGGIIIISIILTIIGCRKEKVIDNINQSPTFENLNEKLGNNQKIDLIEMSDIMNNSNNPFNEIGAFVANCATETMIIAASCTWNCL